MAIGTQTVVSGARLTTNTSSTNLHVRDVEDKVRLLQPYPTPIDNFFMINDKFTTEVTTGIRGKFEWYEDAFLPSLATFNTAISSASSSQSGVTVSNDVFRVNDLIIIEPTGDVVRATAVATGTIDIATINGANLTASAAGGTIQKLAPAFAENASKGTSLTVLAVQKTGYPQILKRLLSMSNRQSASKVYGQDDWSYQWRKALMEIREEWERAMLNQGASYDDTSTKITYSAGFNSLTTNLMTYSGGSISKPTFDNAIKQCFTNGSTFELDAYCGGDALMDISAFITNLLTIHQNSSNLRVREFGLLTTSPSDTKLVDYIHPMGVVHIYFNPQLRSTYSGDIVFINRENVKKRYMGPDVTGQPRKYRVEMGIHTPGDDTYDAQYLFDQGLQIILEESHGRLKRI